MENINPDEKTTQPIVIQNFVVARPPRRKSYDIGDWRNALTYAEMIGGNRTAIYDIFDDIKLDPHLSSQWGKRRENITNTDWMFSVDGKEVDELKDLLDSPEFETILEEIMEALAYGITLLELGSIRLSELGQLITRLTVYSVERKHIRTKEGLIVKEQLGGSQGIKYREGQYLNYIGEIGKPNDLGLLLKAAPYVLLKKGGVGDWALFVQLFGQPFREYRYNGYDEKVRNDVERSAQEMGSAPYVILPDGATVTLHDIKTNPGGETHSKLIEYCDQMISILLLGNTETTKSSKSSGYAQSETHMKTQNEVFAADIKRVRRLLNRVIRPILFNLGWPVKDGLFHPSEEVDITERLDRLKLIQAVKQTGAPVDDDYIYEQSGIPKPDNYEALKAEQAAQKEAQQAAANAAIKQVVKPGVKPAVKPPAKAKDKNLMDDFITKLSDFFSQAR